LNSALVSPARALRVAHELKVTSDAVIAAKTIVTETKGIMALFIFKDNVRIKGMFLYGKLFSVNGAKPAMNREILWRHSRTLRHCDT